MTVQELITAGMECKYDGLLGKMSKIFKLGRQNNISADDVEYALRSVAWKMPGATLRKVNMAVAAYVWRYRDGKRN